jgi:hypothetical protein
MIIVDAGGGTLDLSAYRYNHATETFEEITVPECKIFSQP